MKSLGTIKRDEAARAARDSERESGDVRPMATEEIVSRAYATMRRRALETNSRLNDEPLSVTCPPNMRLFLEAADEIAQMRILEATTQPLEKKE